MRFRVGTRSAFAPQRVKDGTAHTLIVTRNVATALDLRVYFEHCGVGCTLSDRFERVAIESNPRAVVVFPDEFPVQTAARGIGELAGRFARAWLLVVTRRTNTFDQTLSAVALEQRSRVLVFARPVWGWVLLDRILQPLPTTRA